MKSKGEKIGNFIVRYFYNKETDNLLLMINGYPADLEQRGYCELPKEEFERIGSEQEERYRLEHPEEYEDEGE